MGIMKNMVRKPHQHPLRVLTAYPMFSWIYAFFTFIFYLFSLLHSKYKKKS